MAYARSCHRRPVARRPKEPPSCRSSPASASSTPNATNSPTPYQAGESIRALALSIGRSYGFIHALLEEAGAEIRHRGGDHRTRPAAARAAE
ncbi:helix-turn-helix domain-containing protein [Nonomuraea sp. NPDC049695]|uniref:helix-turn-helix domain-containing protein n=1 Tax=Nonomuraea sp. NPDC049695 TaxID=3154734 RepID=UPI0034199BBD